MEILIKKSNKKQRKKLAGFVRVIQLIQSGIIL